MKELKLPEGEHFINLTLDLAFKMVFGDSRNIDILKSLLTYILGMNKDELQDIRLISEFLNREHEDDYKGIIDIRAELKDGTQIQIEMQVANQYDMDRRSLYYWSGMYYTQHEKSGRYIKLNKCISINILAFDYKKTDRAYSRYVMKEYETNEVLNEALDIRFIELPKRGQLNDDNLRKWLDLIASKTFAEMEKIAKGDEEMERVLEEIYKINSNKDLRADLLRRQIYHYDQISLKEGAREEGLQEGLLKSKKNMALKMLKNGERMDKIMDYTELSENEINALLNDAKRPN